jgi:MFS family permease
MKPIQSNSPVRPQLSEPLTGQHKKTLALASLGGALEFYDFIVFVFWAPTIGILFFPADSPLWLRQLQTFSIFAAGYLVRPLGGIVMAHFGDKFGRKRMFTLSVLMMALPTLAIGVLPTYASIGFLAPVLLLVCRLFQGAAVGGEVPGAFVFASEHVPASQIGLSCGLLQGGLCSGVLLGSLATLWINTAFAPAEVTGYAWRIPFLLGGVCGLVAVYLRTWLKETPVFLELQQRKSLEQRMPIVSVLADHRKGIAISMALTWALSAGIVVVILMTPTLLRTAFAVPTEVALIGNFVATIGLVAGAVLFGWLAGLFGAKRIIVIGCVLQTVAYWLLLSNVSQSATMVIALYGVTGLAVGVLGAYPMVMVLSFPAAVRYSGFAFSYNVAYAIFGGLTPILLSLIMKLDRLSPAWYLGAVSLVAIISILLTDRRRPQGNSTDVADNAPAHPSHGAFMPTVAPGRT